MGVCNDTIDLGSRGCVRPSFALTPLRGVPKFDCPHGTNTSLYYINISSRMLKKELSNYAGRIIYLGIMENEAKVGVVPLDQ